jgi:hypothetical protein
MNKYIVILFFNLKKKIKYELFYKLTILIY